MRHLILSCCLFFVFCSASYAATVIGISDKYLTCQDAGLTLIGEHNNLDVLFVINGKQIKARFNEAVDDQTSFTVTFQSSEHNSNKEFSAAIIDGTTYQFNPVLLRDCGTNNNKQVFLPVVFN